MDIMIVICVRSLIALRVNSRQGITGLRELKRSRVPLLIERRGRLLFLGTIRKRT